MTTRLHPRDQLRISAADPHSILKDFNGEMSPRRSGMELPMDGGITAV